MIHIGRRGWLAALFCVLLPTYLGSAFAQDGAKRIRDELTLVQQEQQAVFQQFQMVRELRNELLTPPPTQPALTIGQPPPNYSDVVAAQRDRDQRLAEYSQRMEQLYARYQALDERRQALVEELAQAGGR
jgi:hypothetical protein